MAHLWYLSRSAGGHDEMWVTLLRSTGHQVEVLAPGSDVDAVRRRAAEGRPDGIIAGPVTDALPAAVAADVAPVLGLCWAFDILLEMSDPAVRTRTVAALEGATLVHADSVDLHDRLVALGVDSDRISVAAWGIDLDAFTPGACDEGLRAGAGFDPADLVVLTTRAIEPMYAVDVVLDGLALALEQEPRLRLAWAGAGSLEPELSARAETLGLAGSVHRLGRLAPDEVRGWLRSAAVYVSAARGDGASLSLLEALACGTPVVVTDLASNREWVPDASVGRVFPVDDAGRLSQALLDTLATPGTPSRRRALVEARGDWAQNSAVLLAAVDRLVADRP